MITLRRFEENNPNQRGKYEIHNLISKEALREFRDFVRANEKRVDGYTLFWNDDNFDWVPSIIMAKEDHKKVPSYINRAEQSDKEYTFAQTIINKQTDDLIEHGDFLSLLNMETEYIWNRFPGEYNNAIQHVENYIYNFEFKKNNNYVEFRVPYEFINKFYYAYLSE